MSHAEHSRRLAKWSTRIAYFSFIAAACELVAVIAWQAWGASCAIVIQVLVGGIALNNSDRMLRHADDTEAFNRCMARYDDAAQQTREGSE